MFSFTTPEPLLLAGAYTLTAEYLEQRPQLVSALSKEEALVGGAQAPHLPAAACIAFEHLPCSCQQRGCRQGCSARRRLIEACCAAPTLQVRSTALSFELAPGPAAAVALEGPSGGVAQVTVSNGQQAGDRCAPCPLPAAPRIPAHSSQASWASCCSTPAAASTAPSVCLPLRPISGGC
jgi:hypothetical protein